MAWKQAELPAEDEENGYEEGGNFWEPNKDDTLQGEVLKIKPGKFKKLFLTIEREDGEVYFTGQHANLDKQIKRLQKDEGLTEGDQVHITYLGEGTSDDENYNAPKLYKLQVWRD